MKVLIKNNKLNMDICVLQACIERNYGEKYYGTFDECVAEMRRRAMSAMEIEDEDEFAQAIEDEDVLFEVDSEDMMAYARGEKYGQNHDWVIRHITPVDAETAVDPGDYIKEHKLKANIWLLWETDEQKIQEPFFAETFAAALDEMTRRATDKLDFSECELGSISEDGDTCFMVDEDDQSGYAWGEAYGNNIDLMILRLTQD